MAIWTIEEREEINATLKYEAGLATMAWKAYNQAKAEGKTLKEVLAGTQYKLLTDYYTYGQILNDVLRYL